MKKIVLLSTLLLLFSSCAKNPLGEIPHSEPTPVAPLLTDWKEVELLNVLDQQSFTIAELNDKPIFLESFAVWCPTCRKQQEILKELHEELGDSFVSISLDTDPNETKEIVIKHAQANEFDWFFAVSPRDLTQALINEFGVSVVNSPQAPIVLICPGGEQALLGRGLKKADELKEALNSC